jgi:hypothetical protein
MAKINANLYVFDADDGIHGKALDYDGTPANTLLLKTSIWINFYR